MALGRRSLRITVLANRDIASCIALNMLLPKLSDHRLSVFLSSRVGGRPSSTKPVAALQQLKFFEQQLFNDAIFPLADAGGCSRGRPPYEEGLHTFRGLGRYTLQPIDTLNAINGHDFARYAETEPDLVLSIRYGVILKEPAIAVPKHGVLNLHSGLLPQHRGVMASFYALLNGDQHLGTTLHTIDDPTIDTGRILDRTMLAAQSDKSYLWHVLALYPEGCALMAKAVHAIAATGQLPPAAPQPAHTRQTPQQNYHSFPTQEHFEALSDKGIALVDVEEVLALARRFIQGPERTEPPGES